MSENKENFEKEIQENENSTDIEKHLELVEDQDVNEENVINAEEEAKEKLEEENLKDKFDPSKYVPSDFNQKSGRKKNFAPVVIFILIVLIGIIIYKILGNSHDNETPPVTTETEETVAKPENQNLSAEDYKNKFWNGNNNVNLNEAFSNYPNAKNTEWNISEENGKKVLQVKTEIDISKVLDYYSSNNKIGVKNGDISERVYLYFRKYQNNVKIYENTYFNIADDTETTNTLNMSKREIEISNGTKTYTNQYSKDLNDVYGKKFDYVVFLNNLNGYISGKTSVKGNLSNISVNFPSLDKADEELNKVFKELTGLLADDQKAVLTDAEKAWVEYRDSEFKFLDSIFNINGESNPQEMSKKLSERYKIGIIEERIKTLNSYKELMSKNGFVKIDAGETAKQQEALKQRYAALLSHLKDDNDLKEMKESESKWAVFIEKETLFVNKLFETHNISENAVYTLSFEPYSNRYKIISVYDQLTFE